MSDPWVRFFASDWLAGTRGMTAAETGVYVTLVAMMYERGGPLKNEPARLARLCGASNSGFKRALETLIDEGKITVDGEMLSNKRVVEELSYSREKSDLARQAAETRWGGKDNKNKGRDDAGAMHRQSGRNANQNQNHIDTSSDEDVGARDAPAPSGTTPRKELELVLDEEHASAVIAHRNKLRASLTVRAAKLLAGKFARCDDPNAAADVMLAAGWRGFEPEWMERRLAEASGPGPPRNGNHRPTPHERQMQAFDEVFDEIEQQRRDEEIASSPVRRIPFAGAH